MKILLLTFYFKPDLCAGSFRMEAFVKSLQAKLTEDDQVDIVTTMPNRYSTFKRTCLKEEQLSNNIFIKRIELPAHQGGFIDQARSFFTYFVSTLRWIWRRKYDYVFSTTSRLFTGFLGALISKFKNIPLYLDVRDIFTDTMESLLPKHLACICLPFFKIIEKFTMRQAVKINMVSEGFKEYLFKVAPKMDFSYYTNGIDDIFLETDFPNKVRIKEEKIVITYAGNIGQGQRLDRIVPQMAELLGDKYIIKIIGDGGIRALLEREIANRNIKNVFIKTPVDRKALIEIYNNSDWLFFHLDDCKAFEKVLPSKIFEYAATGKPIIAGVSGYAAEFMQNNVSGSIVFTPCDAEAFYKKFMQFDQYQYDRSAFIDMYKRKTIMDQMIIDVFKTGYDNAQ